ncbi:ATP synthase protein I [Roseovarius tolerans]|uniref:ATP synthase protein I n=1 Tax=Roseovarius tolerans TaxID=74031 RepID=A0A0L6CZ97_9RHOB|nr:AtpZ/AtpI family protein [Roseovarius tolerans]KNX43059.1 ATP synthase protein I [Roseovarius tolerans]
MTDPEQSERLAELEARIAKLRGKSAPKPHQEEHYSQAQLAWRMVIELVAGLLIGFGMGYGLDQLFGTIPIFLVIFTFLGLAAGVKTMMRSAEEIQKDAMTPKTGAEEREKDGD